MSGLQATYRYYRSGRKYEGQCQEVSYYGHNEVTHVQPLVARWLGYVLDRLLAPVIIHFLHCYIHPFVVG